MSRLQIFRRRARRRRFPVLVLVVTAALVAAAPATSGPTPSGWTADAVLDFGTVPVGGSVTLNLTITNTGSTSIVGMEGTFRGGPDLNAWTAYFTNCPSAGPELLPGESCSIPISFAPTKSGHHRSRFLLANNRGESLTVVVTGRGA